MKETCEVVHVPFGNSLLKQSMQQHLALHHGSMYVNYHVHIPTSGCLMGQWDVYMRHEEGLALIDGETLTKFEMH